MEGVYQELTPFTVKMRHPPFGWLLSRRLILKNIRLHDRK
jgi:hypothetical protein